MQGFLSYSLHRVDKKGRVSVPSNYRAFLMSREMASFVCFPSLLGPWLQAATSKQMQEFMERQNPLGAFGGELEAYPTLICSQAVELIPDSDGRIVLPPEFLAHAAIDEDIAFVGQGSYFSLWSPPLFEAEKIKLRERAMSARADWLAPVAHPAPADAANRRPESGHD